MDVLICTDWNAVSAACSQVSLMQDVYLIPLEQQELIELMSTGGVSVDAIGIAFAGYLSLWAAGATVGLIVAQVRKLKP